MRLILAAAMVAGFAGAAQAQCPENVTCNDLVLRQQPNFDPCVPALTYGPHHYTVVEIDRMRNAIRFFDDGADPMHPLPDAVTESRLQTYIAAGITAEEIEAQIKIGPKASP